uniref:(California timema) hypothetical protein n=1 Tax=Timema californicum TaxID=61474 RepID=A0A7R9J2Q8_TIMCA|nr:unnamed protein product [Timema californicum]
MKGEWKTINKKNLNTPDLYLNLDLPVIGSLVYCGVSALDHAVTQVRGRTVTTWRLTQFLCAVLGGSPKEISLRTTRNRRVLLAAFVRTLLTPEVEDGGGQPFRRATKYEHNVDQEEDMSHDMATSLRSELAALQYKRDRLLQELQDMKGQLRSREQKSLELQVETEQLKEQSARQNAIIASLRKRIQELEDKERTLSSSQGRAEMALQTLQRENHYQEEKVKTLEKKVRTLELECHSEEVQKENHRKAMEDLVRRLSSALGAEYSEAMVCSPEGLVHKASELVQVRLEEKENLEMQQRVLERDLAELREKLTLANRSLSSTSGSVAVQEATICQLREDLKTRDEKLQRVQNELRHLLETLAIQLSSPARFVESTESSIRERLREVLQDNKDQSSQLNRQSDMTDQAGHQARNLQEEKALLESRLHKLENDLSAVEMTRDGLRRDKNTFMTFLERLARALNIEEMSKEVGVDLHTESLLLRAEQLARLESDKLLDKYLYGPPYVDYYWWKYGTYPRLRRERSFNELPLRETSTVYQLQRRVWILKKQLQRLVRTLREQLQRLVRTLREQLHSPYLHLDLNSLYQLQRRVRTLREQLQRRDLHLDLLRRKLSLQEDNVRVKSMLETERDEANLSGQFFSQYLLVSPNSPHSHGVGSPSNFVSRQSVLLSISVGEPQLTAFSRGWQSIKLCFTAVSSSLNICWVKKLLKQVERLQLQLTDARAQARDLKTQLGDAAEYKITALERGRKVEELQKRLVESEMLRTRYNRKVTLLKDQVRTVPTGTTCVQTNHCHVDPSQQQTITPQYIAALANIGLKRPRVNFPNPEPSRAYRGKKESDKCDLTALCQPRSANTQDCSFACIWRRGACHVIVCSRPISQSADQERALNEHNHQILREELTTVKQSLMDCQRRENALLSFRTSVMKLLGLETPLPDYEVISRLQKVVQAHRDFTLVSRRYEDPLLMGGGSRTPLLLGHSPAGTRTPRYDDSGFVDPPDLSVLDDSDEVNGGGVYGKRGVRSSP